MTEKQLEEIKNKRLKQGLTDELFNVMWRIASAAERSRKDFPKGFMAEIRLIKSLLVDAQQLYSEVKRLKNEN